MLTRNAINFTDDCCQNIDLKKYHRNLMKDVIKTS